MAVTTESYWWQFSPAGLFITVNTHWSSSFILCCSFTVIDTQQTATGAQGSYCYMRQSTHCSRDKHLVRPLINKQKWKETIFLPCLVCLLRNGSVNKEYELQERRELSMIKLSLWLTYSTYKNPGEKRKKRTKKLVCVNYTTKCQTRITL